MTIGRLVFAFIVFTFFGTELSATTYRAASCNESDVQAAYNTEQLTRADGDIITIPAGRCIWTTQWTISPANSLTIQGAGAKSATDGGASTTGRDQTIITHTGNWLHVTTATGKSFRLTGINAVETNGCTGCGGDGVLTIDGTSTAVRVDHNHFVTNPPGEHIFTVYGSVQGVLDHNFVESWGTSQIGDIQNGRTWNGVADSGNTSWADDAYWGSSKFFFIEDNLDINIGPTGLFVTDCASGGRMVVRYNTLNGAAGVEDHEGLTDDRGCREKEVYHNTFGVFPNWQPLTVYVNGRRITDSNGHTQITPYVPGGSGSCTSGSTMPAFSLTGGTVSDGSCSWTDSGLYNSNGVGGGRAGSAMMWGNAATATSSILTPTVDRLHGVNGIFSPQRPGMCGNGDPHNGWAGIVNTKGTAVHLVSGNNFYGSNIEFPATSPASWPYSLANPYIYINGVRYVVSTVSGSGYNSTDLTLTGSAGIQNNVAYYVPSLWDGNIDNTGYPCLDQLGRGKGDLITGTFAAGTRTNSALSRPIWPRNKMEPSYLWLNTDTSSQGSVVGQNESVFRNDRDYFYDGMSTRLSFLLQTSQTSPFNGTLVSPTVSSWTMGSFVLTLTVPTTAGFRVGEYVNTNALAAGAYGPISDVTSAITNIKGTTNGTISMAYPLGYADSGGAGGTVSSIGVGVGTLANRPTTCTAGIDSALGNIAANGVAYWATDATNPNDANHPGVLYVCNPTNTWTTYYYPYVYPHPLAGTAPTAPTKLVATPQ